MSLSDSVRLSVRLDAPGVLWTRMNAITGAITDARTQKNAYGRRQMCADANDAPVLK